MFRKVKLKDHLYLQSSMIISINSNCRRIGSGEVSYIRAISSSSRSIYTETTSKDGHIEDTRKTIEPNNSFHLGRKGFN